MSYSPRIVQDTDPRPEGRGINDRTLIPRGLMPACDKAGCHLEFHQNSVVRAETGDVTFDVTREPGTVVVHTVPNGGRHEFFMPEAWLNDINCDLWDTKVKPWLEQTHREEVAA